MKGKWHLSSLAFILGLGMATSSYAGAQLDQIKKRGHLNCGVSTGLAGFSAPDSKGNWVGFDADVCRVVASAILGDARKVKFVPLSGQQRFVAVQTGSVDMLSRVTSKTLTRDAGIGLRFGPVVFYDGQTFMVRKSLGLKSAKELEGASICTQQGTTSELNMTDFFRTHKIKFKPIVFENYNESIQAYFKGRCDGYTNDSSGLASARAQSGGISAHIILPERISKEPLAPAIKLGDDDLYNVMTWSIYALLEAEELGINSKNIDEMKKSTDLNIQRFLGLKDGNGKALGLSEKWAENIVKQVGNYSEIFEKNLGVESPLKLERGLNALWTNKGLMYAPPFR